MIHHSSREQPTIAQSSGEAEYYAIGSGSADALYAKAVLGEMGMVVQPVVLSDSSAGRGFAKRQGFSARTRHVNVKYLFVQQLVKQKRVTLETVGTADNYADIGTKYLLPSRFSFLRLRLGRGWVLEEVANPEIKHISAIERVESEERGNDTKDADETDDVRRRPEHCGLSKEFMMLVLVFSIFYGYWRMTFGGGPNSL